MDTIALDNALSQLRKHGGQDLPSRAEVLAAPKDTVWESKKKGSYDTWVLTKVNDESYWVTF